MQRRLMMPTRRVFATTTIVVEKETDAFGFSIDGSIYQSRCRVLSMMGWKLLRASLQVQGLSLEQHRGFVESSLLELLYDYCLLLFPSQVLRIRGSFIIRIFGQCSSAKFPVPSSSNRMTMTESEFHPRGFPKRKAHLNFSETACNGSHMCTGQWK